MDSFKFVAPRIKNKLKGKSKKGKKKSGCAGCPIGRNYFVPPEDVGTPKMLILGDAPGREEVNSGCPFRSPSGLLFRTALDCVEVEPNYRLMNIVNCFPRKDNGSKRPVTVQEINSCKEQFISREIEKFDLIVLVGGVALNAILGGFVKKKGVVRGSIRISDLKGSIIQKDGKKFLPLLHPDYVYRSLHYPKTFNQLLEYKLGVEWVEDIKRINSVLSNAPLPFNVIDITEDNVRDIRDRLNQEKVIVTDTETTSLDVMKCRLLSSAFSGLEGDIYVSKDLELTRALWSSMEGKSVVMHNADFDYRVYMAHDLSLENSTIRDTMLMANLLDEMKKFSSYDLKGLALRHLGYKYWRRIIDTEHASLFSDKELLEYNAEDVYATRKLFTYFEEKLMTDKQIEFSNRVHSSGIKVICEIEYVGIPVDSDKVQESIEECDTHIKSNLEQINNGMSVIDPEFKESMVRSPKKLGVFLEGELGRLLEDSPKKNVLSRFRTEKTKQLQTSEDSLSHFIEALKGVKTEESKRMIRILVSILKYRKYDKLKSTFLKSFIKHLGEGNRVRSRYRLTGTRTGRLSSSAPNLQNVPKDLRRVFVSRPGYTFVEADLSQIELRVAGIIAKDEVIIDSCKKDIDLHKLTASTVSGIPYDQIDKDRRQKAKAVNFGFIYGMQARSFRGYAKSQYGVEYTEEEAIEAREVYFDLYKGIRQWHKDTEKIVRETGFVESPFGRLYDFNDFNSGGDENRVFRQAMNYPVQGTAADLTLYIMGKIFEWKLKEKIDTVFVGTVHDSLLLEVKDEYVDRVMNKVTEVSETLDKDWSWMTLPFKIDVESKKHW